MKKAIAITVALLLLLALSVSAVIAGEGDPTPGVEYRPINTTCGIPAGDYGFFSTNMWWWAVYPNRGGVLKCITHLHENQRPPAELMTIPVGSCGTPEGATNDAFTKIFPDGRVTLICRK